MSATDVTESVARVMYEHWFRDHNLDSNGCPQAPHWDDEPASVREAWVKLASVAITSYSGEAEAASFQSAEVLRAVIDTAPLAIFGLDFNGNVTSWNAQAEKMFGFTAAEVLHRQLPIVPEGDEEFFRVNLERPQRGETLAGVERTRRRKDGSLVDVAIWNALQRGANGEPCGVVSIVADITDRRALEEQLRVSQRLESIGRLSAGIAHDFNNLLTVINGTSYMLLAEMAADAPNREAVENILKAGERAANLTRQLLAFGRRQMIASEVLLLNSVLSDMRPMLLRVAGAEAEVEFRLAPDLEPIRADRSQIEQVVLNLVVNACEAMPAGGRLVLATSNVETSAPDGFDMLPGRYVMLVAADTGCGMSAETKRRIFEPFFTTKPFGSAAGLGLSTVYGIVKQHGGDISVESEPGRGATFSILFPRAEADESRIAALPAASGMPAGKETILIVEQDAEARKTALRVLGRQGYTVLDAEDGREAMSICAAFRGQIHLLLTAAVMPDVRGQEIAQRAVRSRPALKVLFMVGGKDPVPAGFGLTPERFPPFLRKPFTLETLAAKVREVLDT